MDNNNEVAERKNNEENNEQREEEEEYEMKPPGPGESATSLSSPSCRPGFSVKAHFLQRPDGALSFPLIQCSCRPLPSPSADLSVILVLVYSVHFMVHISPTLKTMF